MSGLPLNINIQQICLHAFNLFLLMIGLYVLLYKPIIKFMDERKKYYEDMDNSAKKALEDAKNAQIQSEKELNDLKKKSDNIIQNAIKEAEEKEEAYLSQAKKDAEKIVKDAVVSAELEREKIIQDANNNVKNMLNNALNNLMIMDEDEIFDRFTEKENDFSLGNEANHE